MHHREVGFLERAAGEEPLQRAVGEVGAGDQHHPGGALVEAVHDARPAGAADPGELGIAVEQEVGQGAGRAAGAGMHRDAGRLVDGDQVLVFVEDGERPRLRLDPFGDRRRRAHHQPLAGHDQHARLGGRRAIDADQARCQPALQAAARQAERFGQVAVEAERRGAGRNLEQLRRGRRRRIADQLVVRQFVRRSSGEPSGSSARAPIGRQPAGAVGTSAIALSAARAGRSELRIIRQMPMVIAESATLKVCQW